MECAIDSVTANGKRKQINNQRKRISFDDQNSCALTHTLSESNKRENKESEFVCVCLNQIEGGKRKRGKEYFACER